MRSNLKIVVVLTLQLAIQQSNLIGVSAIEENTIETSSQITATNLTQTQAPTTSAPLSNSTSSTLAKQGKGKLKLKADVPIPECPLNCTCYFSEQRVQCEGKKLKVVPNLSKLTNITLISLGNNSIEDLDFNKLPLSTLEELDLTLNLVKNFIIPPKNNIPLKLKRLNLGSNKIESLDDFSKIKLPALESLDLSKNPLKAIEASSFNNTKNVQTLKLQSTTPSRINELSFAPLIELQELNISSVQLGKLDLGSRLFWRQQKLKILDLSDNSLIEVPHLLRSTSSIEKLILNDNQMTSLRQSDFINQTSLKYLEIRRCPKLNSVDPFTFSNLVLLESIVLADNPKLQFISKEAFKSPENELITLSRFDLSSNNISKLSNLIEFPSLQVINADLSNNPWECDCDLQWLIQKRNNSIIISSPLHCNTPSDYKDIELSHYFATVDCETKGSSRHILIVSLFLLFLLGLTVAVVIQKNDLCRRLLWRDQYGTIYYTKANFPPEQVS